MIELIDFEYTKFTDICVSNHQYYASFIPLKTTR